MVTVAELKKELDKQGIKYSSKDRKGTLEAKLGRVVSTKACKTKCKLPKVCNDVTGKCALVTTTMSKKDINEQFLQAVFNNDTAAVAQYIKHAKANVNYKSPGNEAALVYAANREDMKMLNMLLKAGAKPNTRRQDKTPVISRRDIKITKALLKAGANPNLKDANGKTSLDYAKQHNYTQMVKLLEKHGAK